MRYLFDTNILSHLIKQPHSVMAQKIIELNRSDYCTSIIVACELKYGAQKKGSAKLTAKVEQLLNEIEIKPLDNDMTDHYASIRDYLEKQGKTIGSNDMLIAAQALALNAILITANIKEFSSVPGLKSENWLSQ